MGVPSGKDGNSTRPPSAPPPSRRPTPPPPPPPPLFPPPPRGVSLPLSAGRRNYGFFRDELYSIAIAISSRPASFTPLLNGWPAALIPLLPRPRPSHSPPPPPCPPPSSSSSPPPGRRGGSPLEDPPFFLFPYAPAPSSPMCCESGRALPALLPLRLLQHPPRLWLFGWSRLPLYCSFSFSPSPSPCPSSSPPPPFLSLPGRGCRPPLPLWGFAFFLSIA